MDHTYSATGAIRQHHQQSVRNSLSPSPHNHLYRISPSPTNNILTAAAAISNLPFGKNSPTPIPSPNIGGGGYPQAPQPATIINSAVGSLYRVPTLPIVQQQQQQQQQQYHQQTLTNFPSGSGGATSGPSSDNCYIQGGIHSARVGQYPLRPTSANTSNGTSSRSPTNLGSGASSFVSIKGNLASSTLPTNNYSANLLVENNYRNQQLQQPTLQQQQQQQQQFLSLGHSQIHNHSHNHTNQTPPQQQHHVQMSNNHQQNMNKNRYVSPQQQGNVNGVPTTTTTDNANSNVKVHIQQINQPPQPQQNVTNVNTNSNAAINATANPTTPITTQPNQNQQPTPQQPQYRIFKRGDTIPGISSPMQITSASISSSSDCNSNGNSQKQVLNKAGNVSSNGNNDIDNGTIVDQTTSNDDGKISMDKENNSGGNGGGGGGNSGAAGIIARTPLSQIGEIARFHSVNVEYRLVKETGPPHAPTFTVLLRLGNEEYTGEGASIKKAQHCAAEEALEKTSLSRPPQKAKSKKPFNPSGGTGNRKPTWALVQLTNLAQELQLQLQFVQQPVPIVDPFRRGDPPSIVAVHVGDKVFTGEGSNFNTAKNMAVMVALKAMMKVKQEMELAKLAQAGADAEQTMMDAENKSPISIVHEMAMKRGLNVAFEIIQETGPPHMKVFTVKCKVGEELETEGEGPTKQAAKKASSELMIAKLKEIPITLTASSQGINLKAMQRGLFRQKAAKKKTSTPVVKDLEKQTVSPISRLIQIAHIKKFKEPEFTLISTGTESNVENFLKQITERDRRMLRKKKPVFTIEVSVGSQTCRGTGPNKKAAKKAAAEAAIIALGYEPTEEVGDEDAADSGHSGNTGGSPSLEQDVTTPSGGKRTSGKVSSGTGGNNQAETKASNNSTSVSSVKLAGARQIAPGVIVLKSESPAGTATSSAAVQEMKKVNNMMAPCQAASNREGIEKLLYLSKLLDITVSYSDFPKKNEYLSVVSLTTNPPHVAHGCGATLEEAQNAAALKILEELSTMGLDSVTAAAEKSSD